MDSAYCNNCNHHPSLEAILAHSGACEKCGDEIRFYTVDVAKLLKEQGSKLSSALDDRNRAIVAITLLENAMKILADASNEGPKGRYAIGPKVADLNRTIMAIQQRLLPLAFALPCTRPESE